MKKFSLFTGSLIAALSVALGAFGAHALKKVLDTEALATFETGVKYQMYHALLLLFLGSNTSISSQLKTWVYRLVLIGVILFSGSIYLLATKSLSGMEAKFVGPLTPLGGSLLIGAWGILMVHFLKKKA